MNMQNRALCELDEKALEEAFAAWDSVLWEAKDSQE
jgi:hypothetical protein